MKRRATDRYRAGFPGRFVDSYKLLRHLSHGYVPISPSMEDRSDAPWTVASVDLNVEGQLVVAAGTVGR